MSHCNSNVDIICLSGRYGRRPNIYTHKSMGRCKPWSWWGLTQKEGTFWKLSPSRHDGLVLSRPLSQWGPLIDKYCPRPQLRRGARAVTYSDSVSRSTNCTELLQVRSAIIMRIYKEISYLAFSWSCETFMNTVDTVVDATTIFQTSFSSSLSISFRIEEIAHCSWHQLGQAHDKYSGQPCVFAPGRHWLDAGRLGTRSWPVEGLNRIILIAVFEGQQQHRAINYPSIYQAQAQAGQSWFGLKLITTCASVTCDRRRLWMARGN